MSEKRVRVKCACDNAATLIAALPAQEWHQWIAYILEVLEEDPHLCTDYEFIEDVEEAIDQRLEYGCW